MPNLPPLPAEDTCPGSGYSDDEIALLKAVDRYRQDRGVRFISIREFLHVVRALGYRRETETKTVLERPLSE